MCNSGPVRFKLLSSVLEYVPFSDRLNASLIPFGFWGMQSICFDTELCEVQFSAPLGSCKARFSVGLSSGFVSVCL